MKKKEIKKMTKSQALKDIDKFKKDLLNFFDSTAPMDPSLYIHNIEGKDDMPAHIKSALTNNQISLSVKKKELLLGTWQGIYLFEHRVEGQVRKIIHHFIGD